MSITYTRPPGPQRVIITPIRNGMAVEYRAEWHPSQAAAAKWLGRTASAVCRSLQARQPNRITAASGILFQIEAAAIRKPTGGAK